MVKGVCDGLLLNRIMTFSVHFVWWILSLIWITAAWTESPNSVPSNTHPRAPTRKVRCFCRSSVSILHSDLCFQTLLSLFSFRQWSVSLGNISQRPAAGWWTVSLKLLVSRIPGQKRPLDVCLHRPSLVDVKHHEFFKGSSFHFAQMPNRPQRGATQLIGGVSS